MSEKKEDPLLRGYGPDMAELMSALNDVSTSNDQASRGYKSAARPTAPGSPPSPSHLIQPSLSGDKKGASAGEHSQGHARKLSWGLAPRLDHGLPPRPPHVQSRQTTISGSSGNGKISLRDLAEHSPLETEADAYILSSLEEADPTRPGLILPQTTILGHVPPEATRDAFQDVPTKDSNNSVSSPHPSHTSAPTLPLYKAKHKPVKSTAEDLWQLTMDMQKLERPALLKSPSQRQTTTTSRLDEVDHNNSLVENAVRIMQRHASSIQRQAEARKADDDDASESKSLTVTSGEQDMSAADRWKKLKQTMQVTSTMSAKKSDEVTPDEDEEKGKKEGADEDLLEVSSDEDEDDNDKKDGASDPRQSTLNGASMLPSLRKKRGLADYKDFEDWIKFKKGNMVTQAKWILAIMLIGTGISAILFYVAGNPPCSNSVCSARTNTTVVVSLTYFGRASASWWILFICCRQAVTLSLARLTEALIIDYFALRSKVCVRLLGPFATLFIVQSKGWPFLLFSWGIYDFMLLFGKNKFAEHWLFWQAPIGLFNEQNPSGAVPSTSEYQGVLIVAVVVSFIVAVKRFWLGLLQGRRTYRRYGEDLAKVMKKALWIGQVAALARDIEDSDLRIEDFSLHIGNDYIDDQLAGENLEPGSPRSHDGMAEPPRRNLLAGVETSSRRARLDELLGAWEEPDAQRDADDEVNIGSIIQFRQSLTYLNESFPFGVSFGPAATRQECVESSEAVYHRLMLCIPTRLCLTFDVLALLAVRKNGELDEDNLKFLIKLFRPDRDGNLTLLDFAKSTDTVYKELRLLRASVVNASRLDKAFEAIFNIFFYAVLICITLAAVGIDPLVLFASISGFVLGFAFMIGAACSKYFEGLLLIFVRRPYDIGDRIAINNPFTDALGSGSQGWVVRDIDLYTTTLVLGATNEESTISNGSLATLRIINCARSPKASLSFLLKFPIDTSYTKLQVFKAAIEKFIKARPREWGSFTSFRATRVEADLGFVEYSVCAQHRESWQAPGALLESKAQLSSFALELSKKMDMRYKSPPMPVDLSLKSAADAQALNFHFSESGGDGTTVGMGRERSGTEDYRSADVAESVAAMFGTRLSPTKTE